MKSYKLTVEVKYRILSFAEIGIGVTGFGVFFLFFGVIFFFDKGLLAIGNVSRLQHLFFRHGLVISATLLCLYVYTYLQLYKKYI